MFSIKKLTPIQVRIVFKDLYERQFGIVDIDNIQNPLNSVIMNKMEDLALFDPLQDRMIIYYKENIYEVFHISFLEFINQPRDIIEMMIKVARVQNSRKANAIDALNASLNIEDKK